MITLLVIIYLTILTAMFLFVIGVLIQYCNLCSKERLGYTCRHSAGECDKELNHE